MRRNQHGGGANTNINGLRFENETDLASAIITQGKYQVINEKIFFEGKELGIITKKRRMYKLILEPNHIEWKKRITREILPDEILFINTKFLLFRVKKVFIIEKKFQKGEGSADEKLQTCEFKLQIYKRLFKGITRNVRYIYVLCDWFKDPKYKDSLDYIVSKKCKYYFSEIPLKEIGL